MLLEKRVFEHLSSGTGLEYMHNYVISSETFAVALILIRIMDCSFSVN